MPKFIATQRLLLDVEEIFRDSSTNFQAALPRLNSIADSAGFGEMRKDRKRVKSLAMRQMRNMSSGDEVHEVVTDWLATLRALHQLRHVNIDPALLVAYGDSSE